MFGKLLKFELAFQTRQIGFWVVVLIMFVAGLLSMSFDWFSFSVEGGSRVKNNAPIPIAMQIGIVSLASIFFSAIFVVAGVMRDDINKTLEIVHATPIQTWELTSTRMLGAWLTTLFCILAAVLGMFTGQFAPWADQETFGTIRALYFLQPLILFVPLNALITTSIYTAIAAFSRNRAIVYVSAVALLMLYIAAGLLAGNDAPDWVISLVDPFGANALAVTAEYWSADEQNTRLAPVIGFVGLNRIVWGAIAFGLFVGVFNMFKRGLIGRKIKGLGDETPSDIVRGHVTAMPTFFGPLDTFKTFWARLKHEYLTTVLSVPFYILMGIALVLFALIIAASQFLAPDPTLPTSRQMAATVIGSFGLTMMLIIVFFSGEIMWRDRTHKVHEIIDATPVKNAPMLLAKWFALLGAIYTLILFAIIVGMIAQLALGDVPVNPVTYIKFGTINVAAGFSLMAFLALFVQNFMPNRIVGMFAAAGILVFFIGFVDNLPFFHPLMEYGSLGAGGLSEINGYQDLTRFKWFGLHWSLLAGIFAILSVWLWRRGLQTKLLNRFKLLREQISPISLAIGAALLAGFVFTNVTIFNAYKDNDFRTKKQQELRQVKYEKLFREYYDRPVPKIRSVETDVQLYPSKREGVVSGQYVVQNTTGAPISELFVNYPSGHEDLVRQLEIGGAERATKRENLEDIEDFGYWVYNFNPPFAPDATTDVKFETFFHAPKLADGSIIRKNGTFVNNFVVMPRLEVQANWMQNPDKRRKYDLDKLPKRADQDDLDARQSNFITRSADYVDFKARVCTDANQIPIAPGRLVAEERVNEDGQERHCRSYEAINPILNFFSFLSADYAVKQDRWENPNGPDVDLAIYYHAPHDYNVDLMIQASKDSLSTFTETFGPYPYAQVRIMEFPHASFAQAFAGTIPFSENIGFVRKPGDPEDNKSIDLATYVTMHEIGHQWFAHQIVPADTKGFNVLSEGLTENAAMVAYENALGWQKARRLLEKRAIEQYLFLRAAERDDEPALINAGNQGYLVYNKANWVFWGLKHYIGNDVMQSAIRSFLDEYGSKGPPYPTTHQLVDHLRAAAPEDYQQLITDYWERITFWELGLDNVSVTEENGQFVVSLTTKVDKNIASEETGKETSVTEIDDEALNEWVEIGFYNKNPKDTLGDEWLKLERVRVSELETTLTFTLDQKPTHVQIDPRRLLMERNVDDNIKEVSSATQT